MKIGFLFPGYGSHSLGMGKELYDNHRVVQEYFEEAANCLNINFIRLCFASSEVELKKIENAPAALFLLQTSITALLFQENIRPDIIVGYDLGFYAALFAAGGISFPDGLYLLSKYSHFYCHYLKNHSFKSIQVSGISFQELKDMCDTINTRFGAESLFISVYLKQCTAVISGFSIAVDDLMFTLSFLNDVAIRSYCIGGGLYSPQMEPIVAQLKMYLEKVDFVDVSIPIINTSDGNARFKGSEIKQRFFTQLALPMMWYKAVQKLKDSDILVHIGHKTDLITDIEEKYPNKIIVTINKISDIQKLKTLVLLHNNPYCTRNNLDHDTI